MLAQGGRNGGRKRQAGKGSRPSCDHCGNLGHVESKCWDKFPHLKKEVMDRRAAEAKAKKDATTTPSSPSSSSSVYANIANVLDLDTDSEDEQAFTASPRPSSSPTCTNTRWNTDTGATSSMTPHRGWARDMVPCRTRVRLASNQAVYAEGRGSVLFRPMLDGKPAQEVLFRDVLYVPALNDNLLAIIPMTLKPRREGCV